MELTHCQVCGKATKKCCSGCKMAYFCNKTCHSKDWENHKKLCSAMKNADVERSKAFRLVMTALQLHKARKPQSVMSTGGLIWELTSKKEPSFDCSGILLLDGKLTFNTLTWDLFVSKVNQENTYTAEWFEHHRKTLENGACVICNFDRECGGIAVTGNH